MPLSDAQAKDSDRKVAAMKRADATLRSMRELEMIRCAYDMDDPAELEAAIAKVVAASRPAPSADEIERVAVQRYAGSVVGVNAFIEGAKYRAALEGASDAAE